MRRRPALHMPLITAAISLVVLQFACERMEAHEGHSDHGKNPTEGAVVKPSAAMLLHPASSAKSKSKSKSESESIKPLRSRWGKNWFPNTKLVNQDGKTVHFYDDLIKNKIVAINFVFTSCSNSCPLETAKLKQVYEQIRPMMGTNVYFISISIDPENDTSSVLKNYMKKYDIGSGWDFLTGKKDEINALRAKLGLLNVNADEESLDDHNLNFIIGNEMTGQWMRRSPMDNPKLLAGLIRDDLQGFSRARSGAGSYAEVPQINPQSKGESIFRTRCVACHTIGAGDSIGPDLINVSRKRDALWLRNWIKRPDIMLAAKDPIATALFKQYNEVAMPNLQLSDTDVTDVIHFLEIESKRRSK